MNILVQAQKYVNGPTRGCNFFYFILLQASAQYCSLFYCSIYCILFYMCSWLYTLSVYGYDLDYQILNDDIVVIVVSPVSLPRHVSKSNEAQVTM